jgi:hypothetical protein
LTQGVNLAAADSPSESVTAVFQKHCLKCHSGDSPKGKLSLEPLLLGRGDLALWQLALEKIETGEMPPKPRPRPSAEEKRSAADWLITLVSVETQSRRSAEGRVVLRRLNRVEYENTLRDLLGVALRVRELLPQDSSVAGFDNVGEGLHSSSFLLERYLESADQAIASGPQPKVKKEHVRLSEAYHFKQDTEHAFRKRDHGRVTMFSSSGWQAATLFWLEQRGRYRFRMSVQADQSGGKPVVSRPIILGAARAR